MCLTAPIRKLTGIAESTFYLPQIRCERSSAARDAERLLTLVLVLTCCAGYACVVLVVLGAFLAAWAFSARRRRVPGGEPTNGTPDTVGGSLFGNETFRTGFALQMLVRKSDLSLIAVVQSNCTQRAVGVHLGAGRLKLTTVACPAL